MTRGWPFVGDAALNRYAVFLMEHGLAPYRQVIDVNLPGSYFFDWLVTRTFGSGALAWRLFDLSLLVAAGVAMLIIAGRTHRSAALLAACAFALIHIQDGIEQTGQRDLVVAVCLLFSCACLTLRSPSGMLRMFAGLFAAFAVTIKPTVAPAMLLPILWPLLKTQPAIARGRLRLWASLGELLPLLSVLLFLMHAHALASFWTLSTAMLRLHASLDHRPIFYLLTHSYAPLLAVLLLWLPISVRESWRGRRLLLALFAIVGLLSYVLQHKGYPYHRYPFLAFLLLLVCIDLDAALRRAGMLRVCAIAALLVLAGFIVPLSAWRVRSFDWKNQEFMTDLQFDLNAAGGPALDGRVQCFDTTAGCINTLERMQMVQATGYLYDCYLLEPGNDPALLRLRANFLAQIAERPPLVLVVSNQFCLGNTPDFEKLNRWPALSQFVSEHYQLAEERVPVKPVRWWSHTQAPSAYRVYRLRSN